MCFIIGIVDLFHLTDADGHTLAYQPPPAAAVVKDTMPTTAQVRVDMVIVCLAG